MRKRAIMLSDLEYYKVYKYRQTELEQKASLQKLADSSKPNKSFSISRVVEDLSNWITHLNMEYPEKQEEKRLRSNYRQKSHA